MGLLVAVTTGLVIWVAGWAFGVKSFDAFLAGAAIVLIVVTVRVAQPLIDKLRGQAA